LSLKPGDEVTVEGSRAKNGSTVANAQAVVLTKTGKRLFAGAQ
jgi:acyl-coenzyme A thioesterase PaaI-like protein